MTCTAFLLLWAALLSAWEVRSLTHRIHFKQIIRTALEPYVVGQAVQDYETNTVIGTTNRFLQICPTETSDLSCLTHMIYPMNVSLYHEPNDQTPWNLRH